MPGEVPNPLQILLLNQGDFKQLGQLRPANTTAASIYSPGARIRAIVTSIVIANTTGSTAAFRLFHDDDGTTYDETTALAWDIDIATKKDDISFTSDIRILMNNSSGNLAVRTGTNNALTFTVYGFEFSS